MTPSSFISSSFVAILKAAFALKQMKKKMSFRDHYMLMVSISFSIRQHILKVRSVVVVLPNCINEMDSDIRSSLTDCLDGRYRFVNVIAM